ncbi:MAG TPA: inositol monophosphatase, partial [Ignavibacteria bacterium]|nr:inositol monophosphatase [Ignavibacteria bacterium]
MLKNIIEISKEAGSIIREGFGKNNIVEFKTDEGNLVTEIDKKSEKTIIDFIRKHYPQDGILAEEGSNKNGSS